MLTVGQIFKKALDLGIGADPRGQNGVKKELHRMRKQYEDMGRIEKSMFDLELLDNPYADSRILYGNPDVKVKTVLAGIDIGVAELLLAKELERGGPKIDLVLAHHPVGKAYNQLGSVMHLQTDVMEMLGVPINVADNLMCSRIDQVFRSISSVNTNREVDTAKILNIPLMCIHTPADNKAFRYMEVVIKRRQPDCVGEVLEIVKGIAEYSEAIKNGDVPHIVAGGPKSRAGKIVVSEFTGGTNAGKEIYERLSAAGVGTIISMHMKDEHMEEARKHRLNVVIAPHMASDSLGLNQILDEIEFNSIKVISTSGLIRVKRPRRGRKPGVK